MTTITPLHPWLFGRLADKANGRRVATAMACHAVIIPTI